MKQSSVVTLVAGFLTAACFAIPSTSFAVPMTAMETIQDLSDQGSNSVNLRRTREQTGLLPVVEDVDATIISQNSVNGNFGKDNPHDFGYTHLLSWVSPTPVSFLGGSLMITGDDIDIGSNNDIVTADGVELGRLNNTANEAQGSTTFNLSAAFLNANLADGVLNIFINKSSGDYIEISLSKLSVDFEQTNTVPEPGTMVLLGSGLLGLVGYRMRQAKK